MDGKNFRQNRLSVGVHAHFVSKRVYKLAFGRDPSVKRVDGERAARRDKWLGENVLCAGM